METYCFLHDLDAFAPHRCFHTKTVLFLSFLQGSRWNWEIHFKAVDDAIIFFFLTHLLKDYIGILFVATGSIRILQIDFLELDPW